MKNRRKKICFSFSKIYRSFTKLITINHDENICLTHIFDCFVEHYGKLFEISMDTKKIVSRRLTKSKKENKVNSIACFLLNFNFISSLSVYHLQQQQIKNHRMIGHFVQHLNKYLHSIVDSIIPFRLF